MRQFPSFLFFMLFSLFVSQFFSAPSFAQTAQSQNAGIKMAVIDVISIRRTAAVVNNIREQIEKHRVSFQDEINKEEKELRKAQQELKRQEAILSPEAYEESRQKFSKRVSEVQLMVQKRKQELAKAQAESMRKVELQVNTIIDSLVKEQAINVVLRRDTVIFNEENMDITKIVLERLNKSFPKLKIPDIGK